MKHCIKTRHSQFKKNPFFRIPVCEICWGTNKAITTSIIPNQIVKFIRMLPKSAWIKAGSCNIQCLKTLSEYYRSGSAKSCRPTQPHTSSTLL